MSNSGEINFCGKKIAMVFTGELTEQERKRRLQLLKESGWLFSKNEIPMRILLSIYNTKYKEIPFRNLCEKTGIGQSLIRVHLRILEKKGLIKKNNFHLHSAKLSLTSKGNIIAKNLFEIQLILKVKEI